MIRRIKAMLLFARHGGLAQPVPPDFWTEADARQLQSFLGTTAGAKLRAVFRAHIAANCEAAAHSAAPFQCGWAVGYKALWAVFMTLSREGVAPAQESPDENDPFAHLHP